MLDQGQTITVSATERDYNLTTFDGMKTERIAQLPDGLQSQVVINHDRAKSGINRHLHQLVTEVQNSETNEVGAITINVTVQAPKWVQNTAIIAEYTGFTAFVDVALPRTLGFES